MTRWHRLAFVILVCGFLAVLGLYFVNLSSRVNQANRRAEQSAGAVNDLAAQVRALGGKPVVEPSELPGRNGADGQQGPPGPMGLTGPPPSNAQVAEAVTLYCITHRCAGKDGRNGNDGTDGAPGPTGPPGKDGRDGKDGNNGVNGKDGRGIATIACAGPPLETFTFTFSDGTTDTVACTGGGGDQ